MSEWLGSTVAVAAVMIVVVTLVGVGGFLWLRGRRRRQQGDAEDSRTVADSGAGRARGRRTQRPERRPRSLTDEERAWYVRRWMRVQGHATGQPATALLDADEVLTRMLHDIGYPTGHFVERAERGITRHRTVVDDYRRARNVVFDIRLGFAGTAEIREAMLRYTRVFECLAEAQVSPRADETAA